MSALSGRGDKDMAAASAKWFGLFDEEDAQ
jgi:hypothetical protein